MNVCNEIIIFTDYDKDQVTTLLWLFVRLPLQVNNAHRSAFLSMYYTAHVGCCFTVQHPAPSPKWQPTAPNNRTLLKSSSTLDTQV